MEAIKKKMQSMKAEKDNLMDRCDAMELVRIFSEFVSLDQTEGRKANHNNFSSTFSLLSCLSHLEIRVLSIFNRK